MVLAVLMTANEQLVSHLDLISIRGRSVDGSVLPIHLNYT